MEKAVDAGGNWWKRLLMLMGIGFGLLMFAGIDGVLGFTDEGKI